MYIKKLQVLRLAVFFVVLAPPIAVVNFSSVTTGVGFAEACEDYILLVKRCKVGYRSYIFFLFCCNTLVLLCLVIATKILHYTDTNFTLFNLLENIIEIACPCSVFSLSADLFHKLPFFQALDCRVYRFLIHIAFLCDQPP